MQLLNYTPFAPFVFHSEDVEQRPFFVLVLRGSFAIERDRPLKPLAEQQPVVLADRYRGEVNRSSLLVDSDLAPFKPRSDVHIEATAHAPGGKPQASWQVRARIGKLDKSLRVTGPRFFQHGDDGWVLSEPEPCAELPLTYEHAFGGRRTEGELESVDEHNPTGLGWVPEKWEGLRDGADEDIPAPQVESPDDPVRELGESLEPQGFGPIVRAWLPRRDLAGTYDERWREQRRPALPSDFDFAFYNSAHPDLIYPGYLQGDEQVILDGLTSGEQLRFRLPGWSLSVELRDGEGASRLVHCELDTLRLDVPQRRASLTWRVRAFGDQTLQEVVVRMDQSAASPSRGADHG
jgi:hypothetical protein